MSSLAVAQMRASTSRARCRRSDIGRAFGRRRTAEDSATNRSRCHGIPGARRRASAARGGVVARRFQKSCQLQAIGGAEASVVAASQVSRQMSALMSIPAACALYMPWTRHGAMPKEKRRHRCDEKNISRQRAFASARATAPRCSARC